MSDEYIRRLRQVRTELDATRFSLSLALRTWHTVIVQSAVISTSDRPVARKDLESAAGRLENTYFVRLSAEFEGILKDHLTTNHPAIRLPNDAKVDWLVARVRRAEKLRLPAVLLFNLSQVRAYRNAIAHRGIAAVPVLFDEALRYYNFFLARLPDPVR